MLKSTIVIAALALPALLFGACSDDITPVTPDGGGGTKGADGGGAGTKGADGSAAGTEGGAAGTGTEDTDGGAAVDGPAGDGGIPTVPALGAQIDRMGRPAINTAITAPFAPTATHDMKQDLYNTLTPATAPASFTTDFRANLAILDSLDRNCGNQFAADKTKTDPTRYKALADVLLDDQLYIDTSSGVCAVYLGVEANATAIIVNTDCGGRTPIEDVIDVSYSVLAAGAVTGVTDGVAMDDKMPTTTFPFLVAPN